MRDDLSTSYHSLLIGVFVQCIEKKLLPDRYN